MGKLKSEVVIPLQEIAEELGYSTVQEAIDDGYAVDYGNSTLLSPEEQAHEAWFADKQQLLNELYRFKDKFDRQLNATDLATINRAITFIGRVKYEQ